MPGGVPRATAPETGVRSAAMAGAGEHGRHRATSPAEAWDALFSEFYLRAYAGDAAADEAAEQALAAAQLAGAGAGAELLDVPCGFGRHAVPLARAGLRVTGVDRSEALLAEARRRAGGERRPKLVQADYRRLPFPEGSFDAAVNLFSSLGYLGDEGDTAVLAEIGRVLRAGGRLVIEILHRDFLVRVFNPQDWRLVGEGRLLLEQRTFDPAAGVVQSTQTLIEPGGARESRTYSLRVYTATELLVMLDRAGFASTRCLGSLDGAPFGPGTRLVIVAER
jgi:SAM-dependent methyltransferase